MSGGKLPELFLAMVRVLIEAERGEFIQDAVTANRDRLDDAFVQENRAFRSD